MPNYQFFCDKCFEPYEISLSISDLEKYDKFKKARESVKCPECGEALRKLICPPKRIRIN